MVVPRNKHHDTKHIIWDDKKRDLKKLRSMKTIKICRPMTTINHLFRSNRHKLSFDNLFALTMNVAFNNIILPENIRRNISSLKSTTIISVCTSLCLLRKSSRVWLSLNPWALRTNILNQIHECTCNEM